MPLCDGFSVDNTGVTGTGGRALNITWTVVALPRQGAGSVLHEPWPAKALRNATDAVRVANKANGGT